MFGRKRKEFEDWAEGTRTRLAINSKEIDDFRDRLSDNHDDHVSFLKEIDRIDEEIHHINDKIDIITKCISTPINATEPADKVKKCLEGGITLDKSILEKIIVEHVKFSDAGNTDINALYNNLIILISNEYLKLLKELGVC